MTERRLQVKGLLLIDNVPTHPDASSLISGDITLFLPPITTAIIQPVDQGVLEVMKRRYKKSTLEKLLLEDQESRSVLKFVKAINIKDVMYYVCSSMGLKIVEPAPQVYSPSTTLILPCFTGFISSTSSPSQDSSASASACPFTHATSTLSNDQPVSMPPDDQGTRELLAEQLNHSLSADDDTIDTAVWLNEDDGYQWLSDDIIEQVTASNLARKEEEQLNLTIRFDLLSEIATGADHTLFVT